MTTRILAVSALIALCAGIAHSQAVEFNAMDADASGELSLAEIQTSFPNVTEEEFAAKDSDSSGELSPQEFDAWMAAKSGIEEY